MPNDLPETEYEVQMGTNGVFRKATRKGPVSPGERRRLIMTTGTEDPYEHRIEGAFTSGMTADRKKEIDKRNRGVPSKVRTYDSWQ